MENKIANYLQEQIDIREREIRRLNLEIGDLNKELNKEKRRR